MGVTILGVVVLVLGLAGGAALYLRSGTTREQTIERFARAPVGCTTTLQFDRAGTFVVYIELTGAITAVNGDCDRTGASYRWSGSTLPSYAISMVDASGATVALTDGTTYLYDTGTWRGQAVRQVQIGAPGAYRLTVDSSDAEFAVAIGGDPDADASVVQLAGLAMAVVGLVLGAVLIVLGRRRGRPSLVGSGPTVVVPTLAPRPTFGTMPISAPGAPAPRPATPAPPPERPRVATRPPNEAPPPPSGWGAPRP